MKRPSSELLLADVLSDMSWSDIAKKYGYTDARFLRKLSKKYGHPARRIFLKPSKETLEDLIFNQKMNIYQVAQHLGYGKDGYSNVYAYCREYGLKFDFTANAELRKTDFSQEQLSFIYGTLLGDGYLRPSGKNYCLLVRHTAKQEEYVKWKLSIMRNFVVSESYSVKPFKSSFTDFAEAASFTTIVHPKLTEIRTLCYPDGKKTVTEEWLKQIDELGLAVWYMDDGSRNKRYGTITLCTNCFSLAEHELMVEWFGSRFDLSPIIEKRPNEQFSLRINTVQARQFVEIIRQFVPPCMAHKLGD